MVSALIVAAGRGTRMGPGIDKLFLEVNGCPVVLHTWRKFDLSPCIDEVVLVVREGMERAFQELAEAKPMTKPFRFVHGGAERQDSVWNGLAGLSDHCEIVAIQDGARPCTHLAVIQATVDAARESGAAVAAQAVVDTIKESEGGKWIERTVDRSKLWAVQTPQSFRVEVIRRAMQEVRTRGMRVTDDTTACEIIGQKVELVVTAYPNPKVTRLEDIPVIRALLSAS